MSEFLDKWQKMSSEMQHQFMVRTGQAIPGMCRDLARQFKDAFGDDERFRKIHAALEQDPTAETTDAFLAWLRVKIDEEYETAKAAILG